jgi:predicted nuclease of predicted toxin-antitoxin system
MPGPAAPLLIWVDAQLPPVLSRWIEDREHVQAVHVSEIGLLTAEDPEIFEKARSAGAIVMTKDEDFVQLQERRGVPPQLLWLTCGNISNPQLKVFLLSRWERAIELLRAGEPLVEINEGRATG